MSKVVISGASGSLGRQVTAALLEELSPHALRLVTRTPEKLAGTVPTEVEIFQGDYNQPEQLEAAYQGCDTLLLISATRLGHRVSEHRNAIEAAKKAGVRQIVYTSYVGTHPRNTHLAARDHIVTEQDLRESGVAYTILRDANYSHWIYEISILPALQSGEWISIEGEGRMAPVDKGDVVRCLAKVLTEPGLHANATYEISGPELFTFRQIAELAQEIFVNSFGIREVTPQVRQEIWDSLGIPRTRDSNAAIHPDAEWFASDELVSGETAIAQVGYQGVLSDHVWMITGRKPRSLRAYLEEVAKSGAGRSIIEEVGAGQPA